VLCARIERNPRFEFLTVACIVLNTILLALTWYQMPKGLARFNDAANTTLTAYFAVEMALKLVARGPKGYVQNRMNIFDGVVVLSSIVELIMAASSSVSIAGGSLSVLRSFRILRVFKLARSWVELNTIINTMIASISSVSYLSLILLLFIYICALMGMQLFGYKYAFCDYVRARLRISLPCAPASWPCTLLVHPWKLMKPLTCLAAASGKLIDLRPACAQPLSCKHVAGPVYTNCHSHSITPCHTPPPPRKPAVSVTSSGPDAAPPTTQHPTGGERVASVPPRAG
jgi:hypothetical protein